MKVLHKNKSGKLNEIPLTEVVTSTKHTVKAKKVEHEGWMVGGKYEEKGHEYYLMFDVEEARKFHEWLGRMLPRFESEDLDQHITEEV